MLNRVRSVYTLTLWLTLGLFTVGCGGAGDTPSSDDGSSSAAVSSQADPEIPTVTMPDQDAGPSDSSTSTDESAE